MTGVPPMGEPDHTPNGQSESDLTPVWCDRCQMWVPVEREPHVGKHPDPERATHLTTELHYAADYPKGSRADG